MAHLVFLGDSLTEWYDWQARFPGHSAVNLGISGETVEEMLERREYIREHAGTPDYVFLMTGINNVLSERCDITAPYSELVRNFITWWKGAKIVVQSLLPVDMPWISNNLIRDLNRHLAEISREHGAEYLDIYSRFMDSNGKPIKSYLSEDGVHLANKGYEAWAKAVEEYLGNS